MACGRPRPLLCSPRSDACPPGSVSPPIAGVIAPRVLPLLVTVSLVPRILPLVVAATFILLMPPTCSAQVVINEVLYDPDGSDSGHEFVELMNCGASGVLLTGWVLETGNGANPDDWTVEWIGGDLDYLDPGGIFLIGESDVVPAPDYETPLDLQNGPDAVRLTDGSDVVDLVGWGEPLFQGYYEGSPAEDVSSGNSLARIPDCYDHDVNALDFSSSVPTPGYRNALEHDLSIRVLHVGRVILVADEPVRIECRIENVGSVPIEAGSALLRLFVDSLSLPAVAETVNEELAPRDTLRMSLILSSPTAGYHTARVVLDHGEDDNTENNTAATSFTVGRAGALVALNEIMHSPAEGATEWLELVNVSGETLNLAGWMIGDDADASILTPVFPEVTIGLPPDGFIVVARDAELVVTTVPVVESEHWEALSVNDHVALLDEFETPIDVVIYSKNWGGEKGISLERVRPEMPSDDANNWGGCVAPEGGTPGRTNSIHIARLPSDGRLTVSPNPFTPDGDGHNDRTVIHFDIPVARATIRLTVFDLKGRVRAVLKDLVATSGRHELIWNGTDDNGTVLPSGLYVLFLEAIDARVGVIVRAKAAVALVR